MLRTERRLHVGEPRLHKLALELNLCRTHATQVSRSDDCQPLLQAGPSPVAAIRASSAAIRAATSVDAQASGDAARCRSSRSICARLRSPIRLTENF